MVRVILLYSTGIHLTTIRLCTETPPAGGRVFEKGDELLVAFAHEVQGALRSSVFLNSDRMAIINQSPL
jgi:hypothetical protein